MGLGFEGLKGDKGQKGDPGPPGTTGPIMPFEVGVLGVTGQPGEPGIKGDKVSKELSSMILSYNLHSNLTNLGRNGTGRTKGRTRIHRRSWYTRRIRPER
jgi:hypothetical protein